MTADITKKTRFLNAQIKIDKIRKSDGELDSFTGDRIPEKPL